MPTTPLLRTAGQTAADIDRTLTGRSPALNRLDAHKQQLNAQIALRPTEKTTAAKARADNERAQLRGQLLAAEQTNAVAAGHSPVKAERAAEIAASDRLTQRAQTYYLAHTGGCTCGAARTRPGRCKHQLAAIMRHNVKLRIEEAERAGQVLSAEQVAAIGASP